MPDTQTAVRTVLIVEDEELCHEALELALITVHGLEVIRVSTAEKALEALATGREHICAVITDLQLPSMNGFDLIRTIRSNPDVSSIPIVVISGDTDPGTRGRLTILGANAYFSKPYSPAEVRSRLEQLIHVPSKF